jgi:hypothetical protein
MSGLVLSCPGHEDVRGTLMGLWRGEARGGSRAVQKRLDPQATRPVQKQAERRHDRSGAGILSRQAKEEDGRKHVAGDWRQLSVK